MRQRRKTPKRQRQDSTVTVSFKPTDALVAKHQTKQTERKPEIAALTSYSERFMGTRLTHAHVRVLMAEREAIRLHADGHRHLVGSARWAWLAEKCRMSIEDVRILLEDASDILEQISSRGLPLPEFKT